MSSPATPETPNTATALARKPNRLREVILPGVLFLGDALSAIGGLVAGYHMRYHTPISEWGLAVPEATLTAYIPLLSLGAAMLLASYMYLGLYDPRLLLRRIFGMSLVMKALAFWLVAYLCVSLVLKFEPAISRLFVLVAFGTTFVITYLWRSVFYLIITRPGLVERLKQRVAIVGTDQTARSFAAEIAPQRTHSLSIVGFVENAEAPADDRTGVLGTFDELERVLREHEIDLVIVSNLGLSSESFTRLVENCERNYTDWKVIPSAFDLFVSNLQLETYGGTPLLGVGTLNIRRPFNRAAKRLIDIALAIPGLIVSAPIIAIAALLVQRESRGPVIFRQRRIGAHHRPFVMLKLRTMHTGSEEQDSQFQSTSATDPRVLKVGRILRRWNIDELPQFWNVLLGDMSMVGPRPERPYHVDSLSKQIAHYLPRHLAKPGLTGWAQIQGCRGEGDLNRRLNHDIYYIENRSLLLDFQILVMTFMRWRAPE
jgi:exopolysaccharide biosynthesis polyprenyl glycosylphosphotransferase